MMDVITYCSYKYNSTDGFQKAYADRKNRTLISDRKRPDLIPKMIARLFINGACVAAGGYLDEIKKYYFLIKGINVNQHDEIGRMSYINLAFLSESREEIAQFTTGFFAQYKAIEKQFQRLLILSNSGELRYGLDFDVLDKTINSCLAFAANGAVCPLEQVSYESRNILGCYVIAKRSWNTFTLVDLGVKLPSKQPSNFYNIGVLADLLENTRTELYPVDPPLPPEERELKKQIAALDVRLKTVENRRVADPDEIAHQIDELNKSVEKLTDATAQQINELKVSVKKLRDLIDSLPPGHPFPSDVIASIQKDFGELSKRIAQLETKTPQQPGNREIDMLKAEQEKHRRELRGIKQNAEARRKKDRTILLVVLLAVVLSLILSIIAISKKGETNTWQTSYTTSMLQSSDTLLTLLP